MDEATKDKLVRLLITHLMCRDADTVEEWKQMARHGIDTSAIRDVELYEEYVRITGDHLPVYN